MKSVEAVMQSLYFCAVSQTAPSLKAEFAPFGRRFAWAALYFLLLLTAGTIGYSWIEGWNWFDSLYMAATTVSSVGFMEVFPLSRWGRTFTMALIVAAVTGLGIWWGLITALIVELDLGGLLRRRRMMQKIAHLSGHFIVCGAGRMGRVVIDEILGAGRACVLIERNPARIALVLERQPEMLVIEGDATLEHTLGLARIETSSGVAACLAEDADNLLTCLTARGLKPDLTIVARAYNEENLDKLRRAGADHTISPNVTGAIRMASTLLRPSVVSFLDVTTKGTDIALRLEEAGIPDFSPLAGQTLAEARIPQTTGLVVLALRQADRDHTLLYNPGPDIRLSVGDVMIVLGRQEQVARLREYVWGGKLRNK